MSDAFYGEIRTLPLNYAPLDWMFCDGNEITVRQHEALFALLGDIYGQSDLSTFKLPALQARIPIGMGQGPKLSKIKAGQYGGYGSIPLSADNAPQHTHRFYTCLAASSAVNDTQVNQYLSRTVNSATKSKLFVAPTSQNFNIAMSMGALSEHKGEDFPHENRQPYLCLNYFICSYGDWPERP